MVKIGFKDFCGAMGWNMDMVGFLVGESVTKVDACGGGREMFTLLPKRALGGELLGWQTAFSGDRPLGLDVEGLSMMSALEA